MKFFLSLLVFSATVQLSFGQELKNDSVQIATYYNIDKETSTYFDKIEKDTLIITGQYKLNDNEIKEINDRISTQILKGNILLSNSDVSIKYYHDTIVSKTVIISLVTRKISVIDRHNEILKSGIITDKFKKYIIKLLKCKKTTIE